MLSKVQGGLASKAPAHARAVIASEQDMTILNSLNHIAKRAGMMLPLKDMDITPLKSWSCGHMAWVPRKGLMLRLYGVQRLTSGMSVNWSL